jgi:hypothetical protein
MLALHAILAASLAGACTWTAALAFRGDDRLPFWSRLTSLIFIVTFAIGSFIYPTYRVLVRRDYLDAHAPWAVNLFDIKEDLVLLGLPLAISMFALSRSRRNTFQLFATTALLIIVIASAISALVVNRVRSI